MVNVKPFELDNWVRQFKSHLKTTLHDTCVDPLSLEELSQLAATASESRPTNTANKLIYGSVLGNSKLRENILSLYTEDASFPSGAELALSITQGAISANFLVLDTLVGPGEHVICQYPTYQQLYEVPRRAGAEVSLWRTTPEQNWIPDVAELSSLVRDNTKMMIINNPNNPTGATIPHAVLAEIVSFASQRNITILSDEVFRPLFHSESTSPDANPPPPSIIRFAGQYRNIIATASVSKAFSLPGIRLGWAISPNPDLIHQITLARDYTTISVSQVDQDIATFALDAPVRHAILQRSHAICDRNLALLESFVATRPGRLRWVRPCGASAAFVCVLDRQTGDPVDDAVYCKTLLRETGLLIVPGGTTFGTEAVEDYRGYLRVGFVCAPEKFQEALATWGEYLDRV